MVTTRAQYEQHKPLLTNRVKVADTVTTQTCHVKGSGIDSRQRSVFFSFKSFQQRTSAQINHPKVPMSTEKNSHDL